MQSTIEEIPTLLSIFFRLNINVNSFREAFDATSIAVDLTPVAPQEIAPKIALGPPRISIGTFESSRIEYIPERFLLQIQGPFSNMDAVLDVIEQGMKTINYDLNEITRFFEFQIKQFKVIDNNFSKTLSKMIQIDGRDQLKEIMRLEEELQPWEVSIASPGTPMSDQWFNITISSDIFAPKSNAALRIIKRTETKDETSTFINLVPNLIEELKKLYIRGE